VCTYQICLHATGRRRPELCFSRAACSRLLSPHRYEGVVSRDRGRLRCSGTVDTPEYLEARGAAEISTEPLACKNLRCVVGCCSLLAQRWLLLFLDACRRCRPRLLVSALLEGKAWTREPSSLFHGPCHVAAEVTPYFTYLSPPPPATLLRSQDGAVGGTATGDGLWQHVGRVPGMHQPC
jgi:hypothetical protein